MKQDSSTIEPVVVSFQLSPEERQFLLGAAKGEGLLFTRGSHLALTVEASPAEHQLSTTAPRELAERVATPRRPSRTRSPRRGPDSIMEGAHVDH